MPRRYRRDGWVRRVRIGCGSRVGMIFCKNADQSCMGPTLLLAAPPASVSALPPPLTLPKGFPLLFWRCAGSVSKLVSLHFARLSCKPLVFKAGTMCSMSADTKSTGPASVVSSRNHMLRGDRSVCIIGLITRAKSKEPWGSSCCTPWQESRHSVSK